MDNFLQELNEQQLEAVRYDDGPSLVIAGAGSGKTRVLTNKIMYLVRNGYDPRCILALTFTNKAAREMRERIAGLIGEKEAAKLWMGTFHSMFLRILRFNADRIGFRPNFTIYDTADSKSLIKSIIKDVVKEKDEDEKSYPVNTVMNVISAAKNALMSPADYRNDPDMTRRDRYVKRPSMAEIYAIYCQRCKVAAAMDFDDILFFTNILFRDNPDVLQRYQAFFQYILVDEYQDTNFAQHLIISQLSRQHRKLCVVGDDAQSIYSFRGANISNILNLSRQYPDLKTFKLEQNYRSTQNILNVANCLIAKNTRQIPKHIFSENKKGSKVQLVRTYSDFHEGLTVANKISEMKMLQSDSYEDFAILYRTNAQSRVLEENLRKRNIPYRIYGGLSFYQRKEIKDALAYFRLAVNPNDGEALRRVINYPARGIGETTLRKLRDAASLAKVSDWDVLCFPEKYPVNVSSGTMKKLMGFRELIQSYSDKDQKGDDAYALASHIYSSAKLVSSLYTENTPENISKQENLNELLAAVQQYAENQKETGGNRFSMADFLSEVSLATDQDAAEADDSPKVTLMTVHAAKGLEFKNVFIVGVEDELFPSFHSASDAEAVEEERRLLYVAITRAKANCILTYATSRFLNGQTHPCNKSRFIDDIDRSLLAVSGNIDSSMDYEAKRKIYHIPRTERSETHFRPVSEAVPSSGQGKGEKISDSLQIGTIIKHDRFGVGTIRNVDNSTGDQKISVDFQHAGMKVLLVKFAKFTIL